MYNGGRDRIIDVFQLKEYDTIDAIMAHLNRTPIRINVVFSIV